MKTRICQRRKEYDKAIELMDYAIVLDPKVAHSYALRAKSYFIKGMIAETADDVIRALDLEDDNLAIALTKRFKGKNLDLLLRKFRIQQLKQKGESKWHLFSALLLQSNDLYSQAIDEFRKAYDISPASLFLTDIADCYDELGDYDMAMDYVNRAMAIDSSDVNTLSTRAEVLFKLGRTKEAIASYGKYIDQMPDEYGGYYRRAVMRDHCGDVDGAIDDYSMVIVLDSSNCYSYLGRADLYMKRGDSALAFADCRKIVELDSVYGESNTAQYAYLMMGMKDKAVAFMDSVLAHSESRGNLYDAACVYARMGEADKSMTFLRKSIGKGFRNFGHIRMDDDLKLIRDRDDFKALMKEYEVKKKKDDDVTHDSVEVRKKRVLHVSEVPFTMVGREMKVNCDVNGLPLSFVFDTGASDVSMSLVETAFMQKNGYLSKDDIVGNDKYEDALGNLSEGTTINLRKVVFGGLVLTNVRASIVRNQKASLLLGLSVLSRLGTVEIDYDKKVIRIRKWE